MIPPIDMQRFVSEQVYPIATYNAEKRPAVRIVRLGFSWQPVNRFGITPAAYVRALDAITARLAGAIRGAYPAAKATPLGACVSPVGTNWCRGPRVSGARFTGAWGSFSDWPG
jgi:hypothetical protein